MNRWTAQALILHSVHKAPDRLFQYIAACFDGQVLVEFSVVIRYNRRKQPLCADNIIRARITSVQRDGDTVRLGVKVNNALIDVGLQKGEFDLVLNLETATCAVPDDMRARYSRPPAPMEPSKQNGKKMPDAETCLCKRPGAYRGENKGPGPWHGSDVLACDECATWWSHMVCKACKRAYDDRTKHAICDRCARPVCPACGTCVCVEPIQLPSLAFAGC